MKKVSLAVTAICLIWVLSGCGNSVPEEEPPQSFSNMESAEVPKETEPEGQSDEIQGEAEESNGLLTEQKQIESEQTEENRLEAEEMSILMKIGEETVTVTWEDNESVVALKELLRE